MWGAFGSIGRTLCVAQVVVNGFRYRKSSSRSRTKLIAGVPVLNYHLAFQGKEGSRSKDNIAATDEQEWLVAVKASTPDAVLQGLCGHVKHGCNMVGHPESGGVPFLEFRGTESDLETMLENAHGVAELAEPDLNVDFSPNLERNAQPAGYLWGLERIAAPERAQTGKGVYIYVFDAGVRTTHTDFGQRALPVFDISSNKAVECNGALDCAVDKVGHGTHCAGSAAGKTYGVAPDAYIRSVKVLSEYGYNPWSWTYAGMDWVAAKGKRPAVASMSLGAPALSDGLMQRAVDKAVNRGITVVVSSGNSAGDACRQMPANVPAAITVGATEPRDKIWSLSNYGSCVDIWAPGEAITSAWHTSDTSSKSLSGTSMACPHVSGGAALLLEKNPAWSPMQVTNKLLNNALDNVISGLTPSDTNKLLYVGAGPRPPTPAPAPTPPPTPPPSVATCKDDGSSGPDSDSDCKCGYGKSCYEGNSRGCTYSNTAKYGYKSTRFYSVDCEACICKRR